MVNSLNRLIYVNSDRMLVPLSFRSGTFSGVFRAVLIGKAAIETDVIEKLASSFLRKSWLDKSAILFS